MNVRVVAVRRNTPNGALAENYDDLPFVITIAPASSYRGNSIYVTPIRGVLCTGRPQGTSGHAAIAYGTFRVLRVCGPHLVWPLGEVNAQ